MVLGLTSCTAPVSDEGGGGAGMTEEQAAEQVGVAVEDLTDCGKACVAFFIAGCSNIGNQCSNGATSATAGMYVTDCATAKQLACGIPADLEYCVKNCELK
jgi:hypothetical protein